jgi:hypothetical protein
VSGSAECGLGNGKGDNDISTAVISIPSSAVESPFPFAAGCAPFSISFLSKAQQQQQQNPS